MSSVTSTYGANIAFIEELYEKYQSDPNSVSPSWREFFRGYQSEEEEPGGRDAVAVTVYRASGWRDPSAMKPTYIETRGVNLIQFIGRQVRIGEALLLFYEARLPCSKMDAICQGLRELMLHDRQGVMAEVLQSGTIRVGSSVRLEAVEKTARTC